MNAQNHRVAAKPGAQCGKQWPATPVDFVVMRCCILLTTSHVPSYQIDIEMEWIPRPGDRLFFVADGRHLTGIVEEVAHWVEEHPHWVAISLDDDTVNDDGPVEKPSA